MSGSDSDDNLDDFTLSQPDFYVYRKDLKQHNKEFLNARHESEMPFNVKPHGDYGALELAFVNDKLIYQKIWLKKNAYLAEQIKKAESESSVKSGGIRKPSTKLSDSSAKAQEAAAASNTVTAGNIPLERRATLSKSSSLISICKSFWQYLMDAFYKWRQ